MEQNRKHINEPTTRWSINLWQTKKEYSMGKDNLFNKWCWENLTATCKRMKLDHFLMPYTKINSKLIKVLNVRLETIKIIEKNTGNILFDIGYNNFFLLYMCPEARGKEKAKINYWDFIKIKTFCTVKEKSINWIREDIYDKGIVSTIYEEFMKLHTTKMNNPIKTGKKTWKHEQTFFFQRKHTDGQQRHEKMFSVTDHQGNASKNYNEISTHICQMTKINNTRVKMAEEYR